MWLRLYTCTGLPSCIERVKILLDKWSIIKFCNPKSSMQKSVHAHSSTMPRGELCQSTMGLPMRLDMKCRFCNMTSQHDTILLCCYIVMMSVKFSSCAPVSTSSQQLANGFAMKYTWCKIMHLDKNYYTACHPIYHTDCWIAFGIKVPPDACLPTY